MAFYSQRQRFKPLEEEEGMERGECCAGIPQEDGSDVGCKSGGADCVIERDAMVARIRIADPWLFSAGFPVKVTAFNYDAADCRSVSADELGGGVDHDISTVLDWSYQVGCGES